MPTIHFLKIVQFSEKIGRGEELTGPKVLRPETIPAYASSKLCELLQKQTKMTIRVADFEEQGAPPLADFISRAVTAVSSSNDLSLKEALRGLLHWII